MKTDNTLPLITIGICCYNSEDTVARAVKSAMAQDWPNKELIIIDDGSSDNTADVIQDIIKDADYARLIVHEVNKTFPGALNTLISEARGEFIAVFDDDDESKPNRLSAQYQTIVKYEEDNKPPLVACYGSGVRRYPNGYEVQLEAIGSKPNPPVGEEIIDRILYYGTKSDVFYGSGTPSCSLMTRKSTYDIVGLYDTDMFRSEDADFAIRVGRHGGHFIGCTEDVLTQYSTGGSEKSAENMYKSYSLVIEKNKDYLISKRRYGYAKMWHLLRLHHFSGHRLKSMFTLAGLFLKYPRLTWCHFWDTAPKRIVHEWKMNQKTAG